MLLGRKRKDQQAEFPPFHPVLSSCDVTALAGRDRARHMGSAMTQGNLQQGARGSRGVTDIRSWFRHSGVRTDGDPQAGRGWALAGHPAGGGRRCSAKACCPCSQMFDPLLAQLSSFLVEGHTSVVNADEKENDEKHNRDKFSVGWPGEGKYAEPKVCLGISLAVQWLRICLPMQGTRVQSLVWEPRSHMPRNN